MTIQIGGGLLGLSGSQAIGGVLPPLMTPTTTLEQAVRNDTLGIGYAGGGFLLFYYIGVSKVLQQLGIIKPGHVRTAGASAGVLAQALDYPGMPSHDYWVQNGIKFNEKCRAQRNCIWTLDQEYAKMVEEMTPKDALEKVNGKACSVFTWYNNGNPKPDYTCNYKDRADVVASLRTGVYVPGWSGPEKYTTFRGQKASDGAFHQLLPCPPNVTYCIKVAALPPADLKREVESLFSHQEVSEAIDLTVRTLAGVVGPVEELPETISDTIRYDAINTVNFPNWMRLLAASNRRVADIYPGCCGRSLMSPYQLLIHVFTPPDAAQTMTIYKQGQMDALAWAKKQGWPTARRRT